MACYLHGIFAPPHNFFSSSPRYAVKDTSQVPTFEMQLILSLSQQRQGILFLVSMFCGVVCCCVLCLSE